MSGHKPFNSLIKKKTISGKELRDKLLAKKTRDMEKDPYSKDEERVVDWIVNKTGIGGGNDPIGFLLASQEYTTFLNNMLKKALKEAYDYINFFGPDLPGEQAARTNAVLKIVAEALNESGVPASTPTTTSSLWAEDHNE